METLCIKVKYQNGEFILKGLQTDSTMSYLKLRIAQMTHIKVEQIQILRGYPLHLMNITDDNVSITSFGIASGETLVVDKYNVAIDNVQPEKAGSFSNSTTCSLFSLKSVKGLLDFKTHASPEEELRFPNSLFLRQPVPADNSCLFSSVQFVLTGRVVKEENQRMRHIVSEQVAATPHVYNQAVLNLSVEAYREWIQKSFAWGGAIELSALSDYYGIEIDVLDVENTIINRFGEDKNLKYRAFLMFEYSHYDALYIKSSEEYHVSLFPIENYDIYEEALKLVKEKRCNCPVCNDEKLMLRCHECSALLTGLSQGKEHSKETGHTKFKKIRKSFY